MKHGIRVVASQLRASLTCRNSAFIYEYDLLCFLHVPYFNRASSMRRRAYLGR